MEGVGASICMKQKKRHTFCVPKRVFRRATWILFPIVCKGVEFLSSHHKFNSGKIPAIYPCPFPHPVKKQAERRALKTLMKAGTCLCLGVVLCASVCLHVYKLALLEIGVIYELGEGAS